jgi:hypothetical protein
LKQNGHHFPGMDQSHKHQDDHTRHDADTNQVQDRPEEYNLADWPSAKTGSLNDSVYDPNHSTNQDPTQEQFQVHCPTGHIIPQRSFDEMVLYAPKGYQIVKINGKGESYRSKGALTHHQTCLPSHNYQYSCIAKLGIIANL